jgi:hypothetical protein
MAARTKAAAKKVAAKSAKHASKKDAVIALLRRKGGAGIDDLTAATGWQAHSVRGFLSGTVRKKLGMNLVVERRTDGSLRYAVRGGK